MSETTPQDHRPTISERIDELLSLLDSRRDARGAPSLTGRATGRDDSHLYLELTNAVAQVPLDAIADLESSEDDPLLITVALESPEAVQYVPGSSSGASGQPMNVTTFRLPSSMSGSAFGTAGVVRLPEIILTAVETATMSTVTFENQADASDADDWDSQLDN